MRAEEGEEEVALLLAGAGDTGEWLRCLRETALAVWERAEVEGLMFEGLDWKSVLDVLAIAADDDDVDAAYGSMLCMCVCKCVAAGDEDRVCGKKGVCVIISSSVCVWGDERGHARCLLVAE